MRPFRRRPDRPRARGRPHQRARRGLDSAGVLQRSGRDAGELLREANRDRVAGPSSAGFTGRGLADLVGMRVAPVTSGVLLAHVGMAASGCAALTSSAAARASPASTVTWSALLPILIPTAYCMVTAASFFPDRTPTAGERGCASAQKGSSFLPLTSDPRRCRVPVPCKRTRDATGR